MRSGQGGAWIYVIATSSAYERFKIGRTIRNPLDRAKQLRTGDPGLALEAAYFVPSLYGQLSNLEAAVHAEFGQRIAFHDGSPSEWFVGTAKWACMWLEGVFDGWSIPVSTDLERMWTDVVVRAYEADLVALLGPGSMLSPFDDLPM